MRRLAVLLLVPLLFAGCGAGEGGGTASLWITRDRGSEVLLVARVPAGLTAMQALTRKADVETKYGGRYVQSIEGIEGSLSARRDWFYFVNGIEVDRGAAEYRLRRGDVEWWDFRSWDRRREQPVVVGAFPEPFVHGYDGRIRPAAVRYPQPADRPLARRLAAVIGAVSVARSVVAPGDGTNVLFIVGGGTRFVAERRGGGVRFVASRDVARRLVRDPAAYRFRYAVPS